MTTDTMTPRQRVLAAMRRQEPDRVPFGFFCGFTPGALATFRANAGDADPNDYFGTDGRDVAFGMPSNLPDYSRYYANKNLPPGTSIGPYGAHAPGSIAHFTRYIAPLSDITGPEALVDYPLPDFTRPECWQHLAGQTAAWHAKGQPVYGWVACTLFEWSWQIRGLEPFLEDLLERPEWAAILIDKWQTLRLFMTRKLTEAGVDVLFFGDDVGMQTGMMISPAVWRRVFKPRYAALFAAAREVRPDVLIWFHSDGDIRLIIPDFIEIGLDILNPVQPECMDPADLKRRYGDRLSFWGTIGTQTTFPFGSPDDMRRVVRERVATVGRGGGLYLSPTHTVEPEVPWANMVAFAEAAKASRR